MEEIMRMVNVNRTLGMSRASILFFAFCFGLISFLPQLAHADCIPCINGSGQQGCLTPALTCSIPPPPPPPPSTNCLTNPSSITNKTATGLATINSTFNFGVGPTCSDHWTDIHFVTNAGNVPLDPATIVVGPDPYPYACGHGYNYSGTSLNYSVTFCDNAFGETGSIGLITNLTISAPYPSQAQIINYIKQNGYITIQLGNSSRVNIPAAPPPPPGPPTNLSSVLSLHEYANSSVNLKWLAGTNPDPSLSYASYSVERASAANPDAFTEIASGLTTLSFTDFALHDFPLSYRVRARLSDGTYTGYSNVGTVSACAHISGSGAKKIVFRIGDGWNMKIDGYVQNVWDAINMGFGAVDPFKKYISKFSFYIDLKALDQSSLTPYGDKYSYISALTVTRSSSCGADAQEYILMFGDPASYFAWTFTAPLIPPVVFMNMPKLATVSNFNPATILHESGHALAKLSDEYLIGISSIPDSPNPVFGYDLLGDTFWDTNCTLNPFIGFRNETTNHIYGAPDIFGCSYAASAASFNAYYRASPSSLMRDASPGKKFNVISCGYLIAAFNNEPLDKAHAEKYWPECLTLDTDKADIPPVVPAPVLTRVTPAEVGRIATVYGSGFTPTGNSVRFIVSSGGGITGNPPAIYELNNLSSPDGTVLAFTVPEGLGTIPTSGVSFQAGALNSDWSNIIKFKRPKTLITVGGLGTPLRHRIFPFMDSLSPGIKIPLRFKSVAKNTVLLRQEINRQLTLGNRVVVVGHSLGAAIAYNIRDEFKGKAVEFVFIDPPYNDPVCKVPVLNLLPVFRSVRSVACDGIGDDPASVIWTNGSGLLHFLSHDAFTFPNYRNNPAHLGDLKRLIENILEEDQSDSPSFVPVPPPVTLGAPPVINGVLSNGVPVSAISSAETVTITGSGFASVGNNIQLEDTENPDIYYELFDLPSDGSTLSFTVPFSPVSLADTTTGNYSLVVSTPRSDWSNPLTVAITNNPQTDLVGVNDVFPAIGIPNAFVIDGSGFAPTGNRVRLTPVSQISRSDAPSKNLASAIFSIYKNFSSGLASVLFGKLAGISPDQTGKIDFSKSYYITGLGSSGKILTFSVPASVPAGTYTVSVATQNGEWVATADTISVTRNLPIASGISITDFDLPSVIKVGDTVLLHLTATNNTSQVLRAVTASFFDKAGWGSQITSDFAPHETKIIPLIIHASASTLVSNPHLFTLKIQSDPNNVYNSRAFMVTVQPLTASLPLNPPLSPPITIAFSAKPTSISSGGSATLTWKSANAESCRKAYGWSGNSYLAGRETVSNITQTATYVLICTSRLSGTARARVTVAVNSNPPAASPPVIPPGAGMRITGNTGVSSNLGVSKNIGVGQNIGVSQNIGEDGNVGMDSPVNPTPPITASPSLTLISPTGGERWKQNQSHIIAWRSGNIPSTALITIIARCSTCGAVTSQNAGSGNYGQSGNIAANTGASAGYSGNVGSSYGSNAGVSGNTSLSGNSATFISMPYRDYILSSGTPNDGSETVSTADLPAGTYTLGIRTSVGGTLVESWSSELFTIAPAFSSPVISSLHCSLTYQTSFINSAAQVTITLTGGTPTSYDVYSPGAVPSFQHVIGSGASVVVTYPSPSTYVVTINSVNGGAHGTITDTTSCANVVR